MAGEDVLLRIGGDLTAYEAALKRAAELAGQVPQITVVPPGALAAVTQYTTALQGTATASKAVQTANTGLLDSFGRVVQAQASMTAETSKASAGVGTFFTQLRQLDAMFRQLQGARIGGPELQQSLAQVDAGLKSLASTGKALPQDVFEPIRTKGTLALRDVAGQTEILGKQMAATEAETKKFFDTAIQQSNALAQVSNKEAADAQKRQQQQEEGLRRGDAAKQKAREAQAADMEKDREFAAQREAAANKAMQAVGKESAARTAASAKQAREDEAAIASLNRRVAAEAAAAERTAITQYQQQKALTAQQSALQALPQTPAVANQLKTTEAALVSLANAANLPKLAFKQLDDQNKALINSFEKTEKSSSNLFNPAMIGRVIQVGLAFKALTLAIDLLKDLVDVDRQLSLIAGTLDNLDDRQRVLTESSRMIFDVMKQTGRSADEAGALVLNLQRAFGGSAETLNAVYIPALALTVQKETDSAETIKILIGLYNNFGSTLQGVTTQQEKYLVISDQVITAANKSGLGINDFVTALGYASNAGKLAQAPLQELLAIMSLMGEQNVKASTIGTGLRQVFHDVTFEADRVAAAFEIAVDRANPQPYVLLTTILKQLSEEFVTTGGRSADSMDRIKKAFPGTQELAGFNVLFEIFPQLAARADLVAKGMGASQKILDEFQKSVSSAASAVTAELLQAIDALLGGGIPGKFEGIARAVNIAADAFWALRMAILGVIAVWKEIPKLPQTFLPGWLQFMPPEEVERFNRDAEVVKKAALKAQEAARVMEGLTPTRPPGGSAGASGGWEVAPTITVNPTNVRSGLDKLKGDLDNIVREKTLGNIEIPIGVRIGVAEKDRAEAQKIVDDITAKVARGVPYDADAQKAFKEAQTNVENMTNKISALNKEGAELAKKQLTLSLKAPEGQSIDDIITQALGEYKDKDIILPVRIQMAEGALEAAKAELERVRAIAERAGVGEETRPALKSAAARVGTATVELNKLQDESTKIMVAGVNKAIEAEEKLGKVISEVNAELNKQSIDAQAALGAPTEFATEMAKITQESLSMIAKIYSTIDQGVDEATVLRQVDEARQTEADKRQAYLNKIVEMTRVAAEQMIVSLEEQARPEGEAFLNKIRSFAESLSQAYRTASGDLLDLSELEKHVTQQTGQFIDKLTGAEAAERSLRATAAGMNLIGVEAEVATKAILTTGKSIQELGAGTDIEKRVAEGFRRAAVAARAELGAVLEDAFKGTAASGASSEIIGVNEALDKQISRLGLATSALEKYNNRARDTAIAQAKLDQEVARFAGDTLGYLAARLREAEASMAPLLESIGTGLINVLQAAERATSDFFFNAFQGNIKSAKEAFADFGRSILRELSNVLASAVVKDFLGLFTGKGFSGEGLIGGVIGIIASLFGGSKGAGAGVGDSLAGAIPFTPGQDEFLPPGTTSGFTSAVGTVNTGIATLTGSLTTLAPVALQLAGLLGVPGVGSLGSVMGIAPLVKEMSFVFKDIVRGVDTMTAVTTGLKSVGIGGGISAAGSIIGLIGGIIGDRDVALVGSLTSALGTFAQIAHGIGELIYSGVAGGTAVAIGGGSVAVGAATEGAGLLTGALGSLSATFSALSAVALPLAVVTLPLILGFFEDMGREEILWKSVQKARAQAGFTGDVYRRGGQLEGQLQTGGPTSIRHEIETNQTIRRDLSILAAEAINISGFMGPAVEAVKTYGENVMMEAQKVLAEGFGSMSFETASIITSITHDVTTEPQRILDELNFFLEQVAKFGIEAANIDLDIGIGKNWQGALGAISGVQQVIEAYNDLFEAIEPAGGGPGGTPGTPPVSDETRKQTQLLLNTALAVNVAFNGLTDSLGLAHQATVDFGQVIDGLPTTILKFGSATTDITHATEDEINKLLSHMGEVLNFEQFVVGIKKITDVLKLPALAEFHPDTGLGTGIFLSMKNVADAFVDHIGDISDTIVLGIDEAGNQIGSQSRGSFVAGIQDSIDYLQRGLVDISAASKEQLNVFRDIIIKGLTDALVKAPEKIVGIMNLEKLKKEGETVEQAGQRLGTAFLGISQAMKRTQLQADLAAGRTTELAEAIKAYDKAQVDLLTAAGPEELLAAIGALEQAIPRVFQTMIDAVQKLDAEIHRIDLAIASAATEFLKFSVVAETLDLSQAAGSIQVFYYSLSTLEGRLAALPAVVQVLSDAARRAADATYFVADPTTGFNPATGGSPAYVEQAIQDGLLAMLPLADILVNTLNEAASIRDPVARMQGINAFVGQVDQLYQSIIAGIHMMYERAREDVHAIFDAERERIATIRSEGQKAYNAIQKGLQDQKEAAQKQSRDAIEKIREESDERLKALQKQKEAGQKQSREYLDALREATDLQKESLQAQISALEETLRVSEEWEAAANRIRDTILDLTLSQSSHITNPQQRLALAQAQFTGAQATFAASPTPEAAERVSEMGQRVIAALEELFPRAGGKFESESQKVLLVLQAAQNAAQSRVGPQEEMNRSLVAMRKHLEEIEKTAQAQIKEAEKLTEAFVEEIDRLIELERESTEARIKDIEKQTETYIEGIDKQIEANEKAMEAWLEGLVQWEKDLAKAEKDWLEYLSIAERRDIQGIKNGLAPLMEKAATEMEKARIEAELQRAALEQMRDGITGGSPVDLWIAARTTDMVNLQAALPSQIEAALARQVGSYLKILLQSLGFGGYDKGTPSVPHTTLAQVHKGEMIITAGDSDLLRRYGIKITGGGGGAIQQNNYFDISGVRDPEALVDMLADRVVQKLRGSIGSDIIQRSNGRRW